MDLARELCSSHEPLSANNALPEAGRERRILVAREALPLRIEGLELLRSHARVLGWIEATTELIGHLSETVKESEALLGLDWEVERECDARLGEAHHARRGNVAEGLEHGKETREAGLRNLMQDRNGALTRMFPWNGVLELQQTALAVHLVPLEHGVEWIEEWLIVLQCGNALLHLLVEEERIEGADARTVQHPARQLDRKDQLGIGRR